MKIPFACPSCGASGSADGSLVGRNVRCGKCDHRFAVPVPGKVDNGGYELVEPTRGVAGVTVTRPDSDPVFVPSRGGGTTAVPSPRKTRGSTSRAPAHPAESGFALRTWLIRVGVVAAMVLLATTLFAPRGAAIAGSAMLVVGTAMVLLGYAAGAYGAFSEDFLYGFLYLVIPPYTGYYIVTRWDDLWRWFACSTAGVGIVMLGTQMLRWSGVNA